MLTGKAADSNPNTKITLTKENIHNFKEPLILAAIAWHECRDLHWYERWLIMEAAWNRVEDDFNCNGADLIMQVNSPNQFHNIYDKDFYFDFKNDICWANLQMAKMIITGFRFSDYDIYYWSTKHDKGKHHKFVSSKAIKTIFETKHKFR